MLRSSSPFEREYWDDMLSPALKIPNKTRSCSIELYVQMDELARGMVTGLFTPSVSGSPRISASPSPSPHPMFKILSPEDIQYISSRGLPKGTTRVYYEDTEYLLIKDGHSGKKIVGILQTPSDFTVRRKADEKRMVRYREGEYYLCECTSFLPSTAMSA